MVDGEGEGSSDEDPTLQVWRGSFLRKKESHVEKEKKKGGVTIL